MLFTLRLETPAHTTYKVSAKSFVIIRGSWVDLNRIDCCKSTWTAIAVVVSTSVVGSVPRVWSSATRLQQRAIVWCKCAYNGSDNSLIYLGENCEVYSFSNWPGTLCVCVCEDISVRMGKKRRMCRGSIGSVLVLMFALGEHGYGMV